MNITSPPTFRFYLPLSLTEIVGRRARRLADLREGILRVPEASIYYHTHRFLQQRLRLSPEPPNDFAHWANRALGRADVSESLASIDIIRCRTVAEIRESLAFVLEASIEADNGRKPPCPDGLEFHFLAARVFLSPTQHLASDLAGLARGLAEAPAESLAFHMFGPRLGRGGAGLSYAAWLRAIERGDLADAVDRLDPYTSTIEGLRRQLLALVRP
jgi:hypothetical protein